ncbi:flavodoxin family protein [Motiliproteus sp. SC1-56]|uniref:flavodoxin family protein n=1 Tax=Motiliproteus sp. SC1-56 TaxID=2799565 RepID=UPI001A8EBA8D|nr:NAD(P)H-dependent oxidoreductase [Motiliproteus sp. SC1-56]
MPRLLLVAHAPSPNLKRLVEAVARGARHPDIAGVELEMRSPFDAGPEEVLAADALILGTPENFGYMCGALKDFFERIYYPCLEHTQGRPYALFVRAGNDGRGAVSSVERIVAGLRWRAVQAPLVMRGPFDEAFLGQCEELGMGLAAGLEAGIF